MVDVVGGGAAKADRLDAGPGWTAPPFAPGQLGPGRWWRTPGWICVLGVAGEESYRTTWDAPARRPTSWYAPCGFGLDDFARLATGVAAGKENEGAASHPNVPQPRPMGTVGSRGHTVCSCRPPTTCAALCDYAREPRFPREFAIAFPLVLDAVIVVLTVALLLERALRRQRMRIWATKPRATVLAGLGHNAEVEGAATPPPLIAQLWS